jgi:prepilin peptidase CpaA
MAASPAVWAPDPVGFALIVGILVIAAAADLKVRRISNLFLGAGLTALLALAWLSGGGALKQAVLGIGLALLIGLPTYLAGWFGGGDVKLLALVGTALGPLHLLLAVPWILISGGLVALLSDRSRGVPYAVAILFGEIGRASCRERV